MDTSTSLQSINEKISIAHYCLGNKYYYGSGVERNLGVALKWYTLSADNGNVSSQNNLGSMYHKGEGTSQSITLAEKYYKEASDNGSHIAQYNLAVLYIDHHSTRYSKRQAVKYLSLASGSGHIPALNVLASMYQYGSSSVSRDLELAIRLFKTASDKGSVRAKNSLGIIYSTSMSDPVYAKALKFFSEAALLGSSEAKYNLATMYQNGEGRKANLHKAFSLYKLAAEDDFIDAMYNLAIFYKSGIGCEQSIDKFLFWLKRAGDGGDTVSVWNLGEVYRLGLFGVSKNISLATFWHEKGASLYCGMSVESLQKIKLETTTKITQSKNKIFINFDI